MMDKPLKSPVFDDPVRILIVTCGPVGRAVQHTKSFCDDLGVGYQTVQMPSLKALPSAVAIAHRTGDFDGYIVLGAGQGRRVVSGALVEQSASGLCLGTAICSAKKPLGKKSAKKAALAALHLVALSRKWGRQRKGVGFKPASEQFLMAGNNQDGNTTT